MNEKRSRSMWKRLPVFAVIALLIVAYIQLDVERYLTLQSLKENQETLNVYYREHWVLTSVIYFLVYVGTTALSLPGAAILTLAGGALFGLGWGLVLVSFASTIGATLAFLLSRYLFRDWVQNRFSDRLRKINEGVEKEENFYLFTLRLVPVFPFFMINLVMALTPMKTAAFFVVSQIGMLPGTLAYVNAGTQLAQIESLAGILSPAVIGSFVVLGVLPIVSKKFVDYLRKRKKLA